MSLGSHRLRPFTRALALLLLLAVGGSGAHAGAPESEAPAAGGLAPAAEPPLPPRTESDRLADLRQSEREFLLGLAAQEHGDPASAEGPYRRAIELDPDFVEAHVNLARAWIALGRWEEASRMLDRALVLRSDYPPAYSARGLLALLRGEKTRARNELERTLLLDPDDVEAHVNLAALLLGQRALAPARIHLSRALELAPQNVGAVLNRALLEDLAGRPVEATYYYDMYLDLAPWDDPDRRRVERRLEKLGAREAARVTSDPGVSHEGPTDLKKAEARTEGGV